MNERLTQSRDGRGRPDRLSRRTTWAWLIINWVVAQWVSTFVIDPDWPGLVLLLAAMIVSLITLLPVLVLVAGVSRYVIRPRVFDREQRMNEIVPGVTVKPKVD